MGTEGREGESGVGRAREREQKSAVGTGGRGMCQRPGTLGLGSGMRAPGCYEGYSS